MIGKRLKKKIGQKVDIRKKGGIYSGGVIQDIKRDKYDVIRYKVNDKWYLASSLFPRPDNSVDYQANSY